VIKLGKWFSTVVDVEKEVEVPPEIGLKNAVCRERGAAEIGDGSLVEMVSDTFDELGGKGREARWGVVSVENELGIGGGLSRKNRRWRERGSRVGESGEGGGNRAAACALHAEG
jgi:hypothetical protein